jgi:hypothetical protein
VYVVGHNIIKSETPTLLGTDRAFRVGKVKNKITCIFDVVPNIPYKRKHYFLIGNGNSQLF